MAEKQETFYKQLNCPLCLETFKSPKVLTCLHTFCERCICRHVRNLREVGTQSETITCPVCRNPSHAPAADQTPDQWAAKLCNNSIVLSLLRSPESSKDELVYCQPCLILEKQNLSVAYCATCFEHLCNRCYTYHKSIKMSKDHSINLQSVQAQQNWNSTPSDMYRCSMHEEEYKYFCTNHKELCCSHCAVKYHRKCEELMLTKDLFKSIEEVRDNKQISENLDAVKKMFIKFLESRSNNLEIIEQQKTAITKIIQDWTINIKERVDRLQTAALEELNQICKQERVTITDHIVECQSTIAAIETTEEMFMESRKSEDDMKVFIITTKLSRQLLNYFERHKIMEMNSEIVELRFDIDNSCEGIIKTLSSIGNLMKRMVTEKTIVPNIKPNSMFTFSAKIFNDREICDICSGVFMLDERLVLSDSGNKKLKLFNSRFQLNSYLEVDCVNMYICRVDEVTVAVTVGNYIKLVSVTNELEHLRIIFVGDDCFGIASYQKYIFVHNNGGLLLTLNTTGKIINKIMSGNSLDWHNAHCASPNGQRIYYTTNNRVVTMDMQGNKINMFESNDLRAPSGITVDKRGIIYCCGMASNTVIQISPEGRQLGVLLSRNDTLQKPVGICLNDKNDKILVFEENSNN
ncbi:hypothetical protein CHS0354_029563, partial [Potamilus streckersoni]